MSTKTNLKHGQMSDQNNIYFAIVKFTGADKARRVVLSSDVKDLNIQHVDQVDNQRVYEIKWQDEESKSFDGFFSGNVLLLAGNLFVVEFS